MESLFKHFGLSSEDKRAINKRGIKRGTEAGPSDDGVELIVVEDANVREIGIAGNEDEIGEVFDINIEENKVNNDIKKGEPVSKGRRFFLKQAGVAALGVGATVLMGNDVVRGSIEGLEKFIEDNNERQEEGEVADEETKKIFEENAQPIIELIKYNTPGRIDLTTIDTQEILKNYWKKRYRDDPDLRNSLIRAYRDMTIYHDELDGSYADTIKEKFREVGVPEELCFLAIPESHWNMKARSGAGAVGPYQFIAKTAKQWKLMVDVHNDERMNPLRSGWACAKQLKYLYDSAHKDWNLALSGYNGGLIWGYLHKDYVKNPNVEPYKDFLRYMEEKINKTRDEIRAKKYQKYIVAKKDTINKIALKFNKKSTEIIALNKIKDHKIKIGQELKIPYTEKEKEKDFVAFLAKDGYFENLTYPAKFNAINELIKEGFVKPEPRPDNFELAQRKLKDDHKLTVIEPGVHEIKIKGAHNEPRLHDKKIKGA